MLLYKLHKLNYVIEVIFYHIREEYYEVLIKCKLYKTYF
jgi:hypothetical protein